MLIRGTTLAFGGILGIPVLATIDIPPLGLIVAGPAAVVVSSLASKETRPTEIAVFAVAMTLACGLLFKELLNLPIPYDPVGLVPAPVNDAYAAAKAALGHVLAFIASLFAR
jgi:hypothetical protein